MLAVNAKLVVLDALTVNPEVATSKLPDSPAALCALSACCQLAVVLHGVHCLTWCVLLDRQHSSFFVAQLQCRSAPDRSAASFQWQSWVFK